MDSLSGSSLKNNDHFKIDFEMKDFSQDKRLNRLLQSVVREVKHYAEDQIKHIKRRVQIGIALSVEKDINKLLEMIVDEAKDLSNADGGTLYTVDKERKYLCFEIMQNDTMKTGIGGTSCKKIGLPDVPLYKDGKANYSNVSSYVAMTGKTVNIQDVYEADGFDFTGPRNYDASTGYRSKSMLVIPLKNHENDIIGVLQLLNAQDPETGEIISFPGQYVDLVASLASQAAVALTNIQLIQELKELLYAFIKSIAAAIDEKSPYTGGHINRVFKLTMMIAEKINKTPDGPFKNTFFNESEIEELRLAAWMHDVGKITTPEYVVDKATKLQTIFDRINLIETRFHLIEQSITNRYLRKKIKILENGNKNNPEVTLPEVTLPEVTLPEVTLIDQKIAKDIKTLHEEFQIIKACNNPGELISDNNIELIKKIAQKTFFINGERRHYLSRDEVENLCIRKGSLTEEERKIIENHAEMTLKMLKHLPFPRKLTNVPKYASAHHERLDGSGYPRGLSARELSLQARIMAVADIFEALTARDRPYKKPMKLSEAIRIMGFMKKDNHIDPDIYDLFIKNCLYYDYAKNEMDPEQIDIDIADII